MFSKRWIRIALVAVSVAPLVLAQKYSIESGAGLPHGLSDAARDAVISEGVTVKAGGTAIARFWMRTAPFAGEPVSGFGVRYDNIPEGAFLGVVEFPDEGSDFREQTVPSGVYTLRFGLHPEDGNHMGVAPSRDFALLSPADKDTEIAKNYDFDGMVELSAEVGNPHPTVARLELPEGEAGPHLWENDYEHWILDLAVSDTVVGIVIEGHAEE